MTTFYCVRHGKTEFNQNKILQGGLVDSPLLSEGIDNAKKAGIYLKDIAFGLAFSSPQKRAKDTALIILSQLSSEVELKTIFDLREMEFGSWDGLPEKNFYHLPEFQNLINNPVLYNPSAFGGESFQEVLNRSVSIFHSLAKKYPEETILVVSHGITLQTILTHLDSSATSGEFLDNTSLTIIECQPEELSFEILSWNDTSYLV